MNPELKTNLTVLLILSALPLTILVIISVRDLARSSRARLRRIDQARTKHRATLNQKQEP